MRELEAMLRSMAVQVDPIKPMLKGPGAKRLKLNSVEQLSNFAFKFNLRRYSAESTPPLPPSIHSTTAPPPRAPPPPPPTPGTTAPSAG